ncbi:MAG TPA: RidA family protein [Syntrophales bacterium]|nr:RidA family protein [Syntrophales bacterium]
MTKKVIQTEKAPEAIGAYSQAIRIGNAVYLSGQIGLNPTTMEMEKDIESQLHRIFQNLNAVAASAGGSLSDIVKLNIYLTDLKHFNLLNEIMACYFTLPYPARAAIGVSSLPRSALVEMDGVMILE